MEFLPVTKQEMLDRGWQCCDFVYVVGDAYVDDPSFGHAIISRTLERNGYTVGIISQPDWKNPKSIDVFGRPRLGFLVSAGNMDSMVNHYSVSKRRRKNDSYTPGGVMGKRPDYATIVYCNLIRQTYKDVPILIGGIEASLRRLAHYDYWSDSMKRSILLDSQADILMYGMGERSIVELADALNSGLEAKDITFIDGTVYKTRELDDSFPTIVLPSYEDLKANRRTYAESFIQQYHNCDPFHSKRLAEPYGLEHGYVVQNPPQKPLSTQEMDDIYTLPYMRACHPSYNKLGGVPAIEEIKFSLVSNRGCFGACSFCALTFHQGRIVQSRSHESILQEAELMTHDKDFKGYIHDVGGPTANFRFPACQKQMKVGCCEHRQCLYPTPCKNMIADHSDYVSLLRKLRKLPGVKKVFIRSGIRFDYLLADKKDTFFKELVQYHISGQLKVAPEHVCDAVLCRLGKPKNEVYQKFVEKYFALNKQYGMDQYLVPYLMSSHPGSTMKEAIELAEYIRDMGYNPEQVQDFYPTPSTLSTVMYYTGLDPRTMEKVYVPTDPHEKAMQRALIQYRNPKNYYLVKEALLKGHREDLIGSGPKCLIRAIPPRAGGYASGKAPSYKAPAGKPGKKPAEKAAGKTSGKALQKGQGKPQTREKPQKPDNRKPTRSAMKGSWTSVKPGKSTRKR